MLIKEATAGNEALQAKWATHIYKYVGLAVKALSHWGRVMHKRVGNLTIIGSDNGLSPGRRQAIIWTSVRILLVGPLGPEQTSMKP